MEDQVLIVKCEFIQHTTLMAWKLNKMMYMSFTPNNFIITANKRDMHSNRNITIEFSSTPLDLVNHADLKTILSQFYMAHEL